MDDGKNIGGVLLAFLAGSVVGAAVGLLLAPSSGADTRQKIKATSLDTRDKALEKVDAVKSEATNIVERGKGRVAEVKTQIQTAVDAGKEAYSRKKDKLASETEDE